MFTLSGMKKLSRQPLGQIQASSDPAIMRDVRHAALDLAAEIQVMGEPIDIAHIMNAWMWGMARLPESARKAVTQVLAKDLERWRLEQPVTLPEELLRQVIAALVGAVDPPDLPGQRRKAGVVERPGRDHDAAGVLGPRPARPKK